MRKIIIQVGIVTGILTGLAFWIALLTGGVNTDWVIWMLIVVVLTGNVYAQRTS